MVRLGPLAVNIIAWAAGAATAVTVGLVALSQVDGGLTGDQVVSLTQADAARQAESEASPSPAPSPTAPAGSPSPPATAEILVTSRGGNVLARCVSSGAYLVYWSPAQGYHAKDVVRGPVGNAHLKFESRQREIRISATCVNGVPKPTIRDEPHDDQSPDD